MKNKFKIIIIFFFSILSVKNVFAIEDFKFESKSIEFKDDVYIIAKEGVKATTSDGLEIFAEKSEYNKKTKILNLEKNVSIFDKTQNLEINSDNIVYNKSLEKITTESNTKIKIKDNHFIYGKNMIFLRSKFIITSKEPTIIKDKFNNEIKLIGFEYFIKDKILKTKKMKYKDNQSNVYKSENAMLDLNNERIAAKDIQIYFAEGELGKNARLKGSSLLSENNVSIIKNGIFTACKIRDKCPPWSLKSKEIKHDKKKEIHNMQIN